MARLEQIAALFAEGVFSHAGKPWKRPTNESSNGLRRQYFRRKLTSALTVRRTYAGSGGAHEHHPEGRCNGFPI